MKKKKYIFSLSLLIVYSGFFYATVEPIIPGEALYSIVTRIGAGVDETNTGISAIETLFSSMSSSNIEGVCSMLDTLIDQLNVANSLGDNLVINLSIADSFAENIESIFGSSIDQVQSDVEVLGSDVAQLVITANNISQQDALIYDTVTQIDSKVDTLLASGGSPLTVSIYDTVTEIDSKVDTLLTSGGSPLTVSIYDTVTEIDSKVDALLASGGSPLTVSIYDTVTQIDTKVDTLNTKANNISAQNSLIYNLETTIDSKVNNISAQNVLLYGLESVIDSKVDEIRSFPDFAQTPTGFQSTGINARTSRYFFNATTKTVSNGANYIMSLRNSGVNNRIVRVSGYGALLVASAASYYSGIKAYKNMTLASTSFVAVPNSSMQVDTAGSFTPNSGTQVYEVYPPVMRPDANATTVIPSFEYIPKELYSIIIAPGETVTFIADVNNALGSLQFKVLWEEIINY